MPKITVHEGPSFDPYEYPTEQTTTGPQITETDIKEVADADDKVEYVDPDKKDEEPTKEETPKSLFSKPTKKSTSN